jgi:Rrf2 family protein
MKAKYAIRALAELARGGKKMLSSKTIAKEADIPLKFLETILSELRNHGLVNSKRGIFGGYYLAKATDEITIGDIIRIIDGPLAPVRCASVTGYQKCDDCVDEQTCQLRKTMIEVREAIVGVVDNRSLEDFIVL